MSFESFRMFFSISNYTRLAVVCGMACIGSGYANETSGNQVDSFLVTIQELSDIRNLADKGIEPHASDKATIVSEAYKRWEWGSVSGKIVTSRGLTGNKICHPVRNSGTTKYFINGASSAYAKILGYYMNDDGALLQETRNRVLDLVDTYGFYGLDNKNYSGSNQCILELSQSISTWIVIAQLLGKTSVWSANDDSSFKSWLAREVFPKVAWASRKRRNNWGAAGSMAASLIAYYLKGSGLELKEFSPSALVLSPDEAFQQHREMQLLRIGTAWKGDSRCPIYGIQSYGGIPDELRRGTSGCDATFLMSASDGSYTYQKMHITLLVYHAEALRKIGDSSLFNYSESSVPALLKSILFVIDNPQKSWDWGQRKGALIVAGQYYKNDIVAKQANNGSFRGGRILPFTRLTHSGLSTSDTPRISRPLSLRVWRY